METSCLQQLYTIPLSVENINLPQLFVSYPSLLVVFPLWAIVMLVATVFAMMIDILSTFMVGCGLIIIHVALLVPFVGVGYVIYRIIKWVKSVIHSDAPRDIRC